MFLGDALKEREICIWSDFKFQLSFPFGIIVEFLGFRVDAAKHMWPADIEALQAKLHDVKDGGRPYFFHEVIDLNQNGEISVNEYFGVGQTTEFRYCVKIKQCADGFWACPGVYDQVSIFWGNTL